MSVTRATLDNPAPSATATMLLASAAAIGWVSAKAPLPTFTSITRPSRPAASFFDRIEAVMRGIDSPVAVTSRPAYGQRWGGRHPADGPILATQEDGRRPGGGRGCK